MGIGHSHARDLRRDLPDLDHPLEHLSTDASRPSAGPLIHKVKNLWLVKKASKSWHIDIDLHDLEDDDLLGVGGGEKKFLGLYSKSEIMKWNHLFGILEKVERTRGIPKNEVKLALDTTDDHIHQLFYFLGDEPKDDNILCEIAARRLASFDTAFAFVREIADGSDLSKHENADAIGIRGEWESREGRAVVKLLTGGRVQQPHLDVTMVMWMRLQDPKGAFLEDVKKDETKKEMGLMRGTGANGASAGQSDAQESESTVHSADNRSSHVVSERSAITPSEGKAVGGGAKTQSSTKPDRKNLSERPRLIGQSKPGLGVAKDIHNMMIYLATMAKRDCLCNRPQYFHNALLYCASTATMHLPKGVPPPKTVSFPSDASLPFSPVDPEQDRALARLQRHCGHWTDVLCDEGEDGRSHEGTERPSSFTWEKSLGVGYWFLNPEFEGIFRTLCNDLRENIEEKGLAVVTRAIHMGQLRLRKSGTRVIWKAQEQVFPISDRMVAYLNSKEYLTVLRKNTSKGVFFIDWDAGLASNDELQNAPRIEDVDTTRKDLSQERN